MLGDLWQDKAYKYCVGTGWRNVEYRSFTFVDEDNENASLAETEHSRESRRGSEIPLTKEELRNLRATTKTVDGESHLVPAVQAKV